MLSMNSNKRSHPHNSSSTKQILDYLLDVGVHLRLNRGSKGEDIKRKEVELIIDGILSNSSSTIHLPPSTAQRLFCYHLLGHLDGQTAAEAIPSFLRLSALKAREMLEQDRHLGEDGGTLEEWYAVLLELVIQGAIEKLDNPKDVIDVFAYGEVEEEEEEEEELEHEEGQEEGEEEHDDDEEEEEEEDEDDHDHVPEGAALRRADHHLLFAKTDARRKFLGQLHEYKTEFMAPHPDLTPEERKSELREKHPYDHLRALLRGYISRVISALERPVLKQHDDKDHPLSVALTPYAAHFRSVSGTLLMPELVDSEVDTDAENHEEGDEVVRPVKRVRQTA
ncbi:uncharacterized protein VTP21DRAFT_10284 [Calcarisporiella thermophila]|uniref:uncharacterized protein n=1 Tax=Calcarisporiella thermophila TaxID=911321 RepID=UPI0037434A89